MSSERKIDVFAALVLVISIIGIILLATQYFASLYIGVYRHSCLDCEYATPGDLTSQILILIFLIIQIIVALNDLIPKRFIQRDLSLYGMGLAIFTILFSIIGIVAFGTYYDYAEWWPDTGFYASIIAGIVNTILFFLKFRNK
ncbi:MAG: hypothetical protein ACFE9N_04725 [Promethearchaeota archaeon]